MTMTYPRFQALTRAKSLQIIEELGAEAAPSEADLSFFFYGSGRIGPAGYIDGSHLLPGPLEATAVEVSENATLGVIPGWSFFIDICATEYITITDSTLCAYGEYADGGGADGSAAGGGGTGGGGALNGQAGVQANTGAGESAQGDPQINMSAEYQGGYRAASGNGGSSLAHSGGEGASDSFPGFYYYPPFKGMLQGGVAPAHPVSIGGYGGAAGAGDGEFSGGSGGGGGGGGGAIVLRAPTITVARSTLDVQGGAGGGGGSATLGGSAGGGGGGGGGNGGTIIFVAETLNLDGNSYYFSGGEGGSGGAGYGEGQSGSNGEYGTQGILYWYKPSTNTWTNLD